MKTSILTVFVSVSLASKASAGTYVTEADFELAVTSNRITTSAHVDATGQEVSDVRVFAYNFGEDPADPYYLNDPGFGAAVGSGLPAGSQLSFNVLDHLRFWDGNGRVAFGATEGAEFIRINRGVTNVDVTSSSNPMSGFAIANVASGGVMHAHLNSYLMAADLQTPASGVYFLPIDVGVSTGGIDRSLPAYVVFNNGAADSALNAAITYLAAPLPGDANFDGRVDTADFNELAGHFGASTGYFFTGDFDENGLVNTIDFNLLAANYGRTNATVSASLVPEPSMLASLALLMLFARRR